MRSTKLSDAMIDSMYITQRVNALNKNYRSVHFFFSAIAHRVGLESISVIVFYFIRPEIIIKPH